MDMVLTDPPYGFNSRLREEATSLSTSAASSGVVSTHASVRRRHIAIIPVRYGYEFQLTPP